MATVHPIIPLSYNLAGGKRKYVLFCGAGVSKDAGISTGWEVLLETLRRIRAQEEGKKTDYNDRQMEEYYELKYKDFEYAQIIRSLFPANEEQREFLQELFKNKSPGKSHQLIAEWVKQGLVKFVITTNFDSMIEYALDEIGFRGKYSVISDGEQIKNSKPWVHEDVCRIYKIHGTIEQGKIRNTEKDLKQLDKKMTKDCLDILERHGVIVLGYAGNDKGTMNIFNKRRFRGYSLYWTVYNKQISSNVEKLLTKQEGIKIEIKDAVDFLEEVSNRVEIAESELMQTESSVSRVRFKNLMKKSNVEIMQTIDDERIKLKKFIKKILDEIETDEELLWEGYIKTFNFSVNFFLLVEQIIKYKNNYWKNILPIFEEVYSLNETGYRNGKNGLVNYCFFSFFEIIGAILLENNAFIQIREMLEIKRLNHQNIFKNILNWNNQASFIKSKNEKETKGWIFPKMEYFLQLVESQKVPFEFNLKQRILEVDLLYFIYSVQNNSKSRPFYWFPLSSVYFNRKTPEFLVKIKQDELFKKRIEKELLNLEDNDLDKVMEESKNTLRDDFSKGSLFFTDIDDLLQKF